MRLAERNTIEDEYGNVSTGWVDRFETFANISPLVGGETVQAARLAGRQPVVIRLRLTPDSKLVRTDWKATNVTTGTEYNIRTVIDPYEDETDHGRWIDMLAEAGVAV